MEAGGVQPGPEPFVGAEVVHSSERTRVTRLFLPGRTVIRKESPGPDAERRARQQVAMLERSPGVARVTQLAAASRYPGWSCSRTPVRRAWRAWPSRCRSTSHSLGNGDGQWPEKGTSGYSQPDDAP
jgi:hypothetical protein